MNQNTSNLLSTTTLWTALVTPFDIHGELDIDSLQSIAQQQAHAGNGLLLLGSTGEALALTFEQQLQVVQAVCALKLSVPILVGVGGFQLTQQLKWIETCNELAIDGYLLAAPLYAKPGAEGQFQWFSSLLNVSRLPCMLYNVPSRSGVSLSVQALTRLQTHPNFWALKEASGEIEQFLNYKQALPEITLFSGEDALLPYLVPAGAKGLVSVAANVWPLETHHYVQLALAGDTQALYSIWRDAVASLFRVANPIPAKALMHRKSMIKTPQLKLPLTHQELDDCQELLKADHNINLWFQQFHLPLKQARA